MDSTSFHKDSLCVFNLKHALIITKQKIATNFIKSFFKSEEAELYGINSEEFNSPNYFVHYSSKLGYWVVEPTSTPSELEEPRCLSNKTALNDFLNENTTKKDVIILIRNPWERFKSALIEDFIKFYFVNANQSLSLIGTYILKNELGEDDKLTIWWKNNKDKVSAKYFKMLDTYLNETWEDEYYECLTVIFKVLLLLYFNERYPTNIGHNQPYHTLISNIVLSNKNKKIKIFDIDKVNLNRIFSKYTIGVQNIGKKNPSGFLKKLVNDILNDSDFLEHRDNVIDSLSYEFLSYDALSLISQTENI